jgi:hypothetical protein
MVAAARPCSTVLGASMAYAFARFRFPAGARNIRAADRRAAAAGRADDAVVHPADRAAARQYRCSR